jgi:acetyl esterase
MPLDPEAKAILDLLDSIGFPVIHTKEPDDLRAFLGAMTAGSPPGPDVAAVTDSTVPGPAGDIPIRVYSPAGTGPFPLFVYYHGGGWVLGDIAGSDAYARTLANEAGCVVVSVEYRLAPEHRYPAAIDDCWAATVHIAANTGSYGGDPNRLVVGGDSAGGNLAAAVALRARDQGGPAIALQVLGCPVTDHDFGTGSYEENAAGPLLLRDDMVWFWDHYAPDGSQRDDADASPLRAASLAGLPPAYVITAELDVLRDEGEAYAARLREAGVPVTQIRYDGMFHAFNTFGAALTRAVEAIGGIAAAVKATG